MSTREPVPEEILARYRRGLFDPLLMDVLVRREFNCPVIQEDPGRKSVWGTTRPLRAAAVSYLVLVVKRDPHATAITERFFRGSPQKAPLQVSQEASLCGVAGAAQLARAPDAHKLRWLLLGLFGGDVVAKAAERILALPPLDLAFVVALRFLATKAPSEVKPWHAKAILLACCLGADLPSPAPAHPARPTPQLAHACCLWENTLFCVMLLLQAMLLSEEVLLAPVATLVDYPVLLASFERLQGRDDWEAALGSQERATRFRLMWDLAVGTPLSASGGGQSAKKQ